MRSSHCDADTPGGAKFCIECGTSLTPRCPRCGVDTLPRAKLCAECGIPLTAQSPAPSAPPPSPRRYTPGYLAEKTLHFRSALEGERKQVTVLFADLKDSTELIRGLDPEAAQQLLDRAIHHMMDAVHRIEGTVNQVLGDGIIALFSAPIAHEDHALRACYAALAMQAAMRAYTEEVRRTRGLAHLQAVEFLYETRLFPEPEYTFKHALTHEVAYGSLLLERRRGLHARLVEAIELYRTMAMTFWLPQAETALARVEGR